MSLISCGDLLRDHAATRGQDPALAYSDGSDPVRLSWRLVEQQVAAAGSRLEDRGLQPGEAVVLLLDDPMALAIGVLAVMASGGIAVPTPTYLTPKEIAHVLGDASPALVVSGDDMGSRLPDVGRGQTDRIDLGPSTLRPQPLLTNRQGATRHLEGEVTAGIILYTSGSTAAPKGVLLDEAAVLNAGASNAWSQALRPDDTHGVVLPLHHSNALFLQLFASFVVGATTAFAAFDRATYWRDMSTLRATVGNLVAPAIRSLLRAADGAGTATTATQLRLMMYGLNLSAAEIERFERNFAPLMMVYGLTESAACGTRTPAFALRRPDRIGVAQPGWELRVVTSDGVSSARGVSGELQMRGPSLMQKYVNLPEETRSIIQDGWLSTGDLVRIDELGFVHFVDRIKDLVKVRGRSVATLEVEAALRTAPGVADCAVIGTEHDRDGETLVAFVEMQGDSGIESVRAHLESELAFYKVPRFIIHLAGGLPKTSVGKAEKSKLREVARQHLAGQEGCR